MRIPFRKCIEQLVIDYLDGSDLVTPAEFIDAIEINHRLQNNIVDITMSGGLNDYLYRLFEEKGYVQVSKHEANCN